ncbi:hypothetical protein HY932_00395 [Candidatus Falkowbacteria bacterium]|nr:hypothetical protein [Candidatus Falkowbacteria bacterium]
MTMVKTTTKQKVAITVGIVAILAATMGFLTAIGKSMGFGFGYPFVRNPIANQSGDTGSDEKAMLPAYNEAKKTIRTTPTKTSLPKKKTSVPIKKTSIKTSVK